MGGLLLVQPHDYPYQCILMTSEEQLGHRGVFNSEPLQGDVAYSTSQQGADGDVLNGTLQSGSVLCAGIFGCRWR